MDSNSVMMLEWMIVKHKTAVTGKSFQKTHFKNYWKLTK